MDKNVSQNQKELEAETIDRIARFLIFSARNLRQKERDKEAYNGGSVVFQNVRKHHRGSENASPVIRNHFPVGNNIGEG